MGCSAGLIGDVLAIAGDSVDNIPGAGIGRKAAAKLSRNSAAWRSSSPGRQSEERKNPEKLELLGIKFCRIANGRA